MDADRSADEAEQRAEVVAALVRTLRERARAMDLRGRIVLFALIGSVAFGLGYYVAVPIFIDLQRQLAQVYEEQITLLQDELAELTPRFTRLRDAAAARVEIVWQSPAAATSYDLLRQARLGDGRIVAVGGDPASGRAAAWISDDDGKSWERRAIDFPGRLTNLVALPGGRLVATLNEGRLARSADRGDTWQLVYAAEDADPFHHVEAAPDGLRLFAAGGDGAGLVGSDDEGLSWRAAPVEGQLAAADRLGGSVRRVRFTGDGGALGFGDDGRLFRFADGRWRLVPLGDNAPSNFADAEVVPEDGWVVAVGGPGVVALSGDAGASWRLTSSAVERPLFDVALDPATGLAVAVGDGGVIAVSRDLGKRWEPRESGVTARLRDVRILGGGAVVVAVGDGGTTVRSEDAGESWTYQSSGVSNDLRDVLALPDKTLVAVGESGAIARTTGVFGAAVASAADEKALRTTLEALPPHARLPTEFEELRAIEESRARIEVDVAAAKERLDAAKGGRLTRRERMQELAAFLADCAGASPAPETVDACVAGYRAAVDPDGEAGVWRELAEKAPGAILLLFLLATLGALYRYNLRMAGFYNARADAIEFAGTSGEQNMLAALADVFAAEKVEFGAGKTPSEQAALLAERVVERVRPRG